MAEEARLESVWPPKAAPGFESLSFRAMQALEGAARKCGVFTYRRVRRELAHARMCRYVKTGTESRPSTLCSRKPREKRGASRANPSREQNTPSLHPDRPITLLPCAKHPSFAPGEHHPLLRQPINLPDRRPPAFRPELRRLNKKKSIFTAKNKKLMSNDEDS